MSDARNGIVQIKNCIINMLKKTLKIKYDEQESPFLFINRKILS